MAARPPVLVPLGGDERDAAMQQTPWLSRVSLSSLADAADAFLARAGFDRGPWIAVTLAAGIGAWFVLPDAAGWIAAIAFGLLVALGALALWKGREDRAHLVMALVTCGLVFAFGTGLIWARSEVAGAAAFERPLSGVIEGRVLERIEQPAQDRIRLVLAIRSPEDGEPVRVRVNVPLEQAIAGSDAPEPLQRELRYWKTRSATAQVVPVPRAEDELAKAGHGEEGRCPARR